MSEEWPDGYVMRMDADHQREREKLRRLVEEAQSERDRAYLTSAECLAAKNNAVTEVDRLKGELAEERKASERLRFGIQAYCDSENEWRAECDALKGELAEARRLSVIGQAAVDWATDTGECHFCHMDGDAHDIEVCPIAATPAEQEQGDDLAETDTRKQLQEASHLLGKLAKRLEALEEAQQESTAAWTEAARCLADRLDALSRDWRDLDEHRAAHSKRIDELDAKAQEDAKAWAEVALRASGRIDALEAWARRRTVEPWFNADPKMTAAAAPPPPEAAAPGHAWREPHEFVPGHWPGVYECRAPTKSPNNEACGLDRTDSIHVQSKGGTP